MGSMYQDISSLVGASLIEPRRILFRDLNASVSQKWECAICYTCITGAFCLTTGVCETVNTVAMIRANSVIDVE